MCFLKVDVESRRSQHSQEVLSFNEEILIKKKKKNPKYYPPKKKAVVLVKNNSLYVCHWLCSRCSGEDRQKGMGPVFKSAKNHPTSGDSPVIEWIFFSVPKKPLWRSRISSGLGYLQAQQN